MSQFSRGNFNLTYDFNFTIVNRIRGLRVTMPKVDGIVYKMRNWIFTSAGVTGSCVMGVYDDSGNLVPQSQTNINPIASGNNLIYYTYTGKQKPILKANKTYTVIAHATQVGAGTLYLGGQSTGNNLYNYTYTWTDGTLPATATFTLVGNYQPIIQIYLKMRGRPAVLTLGGRHTNALSGLGLEPAL